MIKLSTMKLNVIFSMLFQILEKLFTLILLLLISRVFSVNDIGVYYYIFNAVFLLTVAIAEFGIDDWAVREISKGNNEIIHKILNVKIMLAIGYFIITNIILHFIDPSLIILTFLLSLAQSIFIIRNFLLRLLQTENKIMLYNILHLTFIIPYFILTIFLLSFGLTGIFLSYLIISILSFIIVFIFTKRFLIKFKFDFNLNHIKYIVKQSYPFWLTTLFMRIYYNIDSFIISIMSGYAANAIYNIAYNVMSGLSFITSAINLVIYPILSKLHKDCNKVEIKNIMNKIFFYLHIFAILLFITINIFADKIIIILFTEKFVGSIIALRLLTIASIFTFYSATLGFFFNAINQERLFLKAVTVGCIINIILDIIMIALWGYIGACIATIIAELSVTIYLYYHYRQWAKGDSLKG